VIGRKTLRARHQKRGRKSNAHLGTTADSLPALVEQLGRRAFGHTPRVGDAFCGGGSVPFEAARIGCEAFGSDLNSIAALLTWASLHLLGSASTIREEVTKLQSEQFARGRSADHSMGRRTQ
jgi:adenine-specific DNA methylase